MLPLQNGFSPEPFGSRDFAPFHSGMMDFLGEDASTRDPMAAGDLGQQEQLPPSPIEQLMQWAQMTNVCEALTETELGVLGQKVVEEYEIDKRSRSDWEREARMAMDAVLQKQETKNYPFENAANIKYPLLTTAALQFAARAYPAIVQGKEPVKAQVWGQDRNHMKQARADRVTEFMSYQLTADMPEWESDKDTMLHQMPVVGGSVVKVYYSESDKRPKSEMVSLLNLVVNQSARSLDTVPRVTQEFDRYPHEIRERMRLGVYRTADIDGTASGEQTSQQKSTDQADPFAPHLLLEQHTFYDMDGDGVEEPWIITVHKATQQVLRIQANYDVNKIAVSQETGDIVKFERYNYFVLYPFLPDPNGGFYPIGFGKLLHSITETINATLNQLIDAGHLQNAGGGFIGSGVTLKKGEMRVQMNRWTYVNGASGAQIREAIVPHTFPGPSSVLFQLLGMMVDMGKQITSVQDILTGDITAKTMQPTTLLALIEQGLKVFTAIYKRIYRALKQEFKLLYDLNGRYPDEDKYQRVIDWSPPQNALQGPQGLPGLPAPMMGHNGGLPMDMGQGAPGAQPAPPIPFDGSMGQPNPMLPPGLPPQLPHPMIQPTMATDFSYDDCDILPVADPNIVTDMQRLAKAQIIQENMGHPNINKEAAIRRIFDTAAIDNPDELIVPTPPPPPPPPEVVANAEAELKIKESTAAKNLASAQLQNIQAAQVAQTLPLQNQAFWEAQQAALEQEVQRRLEDALLKMRAEQGQIPQMMPDNMMLPPAMPQPQGMPNAPLA